MSPRSPLSEVRQLVAEYRAAEQALQAAVRTEMTLQLEEPLVRIAAEATAAGPPEGVTTYRQHRQQMILAHTDVLQARTLVQAARFQVQIALAHFVTEDLL